VISTALKNGRAEKEFAGCGHRFDDAIESHGGRSFARTGVQAGNRCVHASNRHYRFRIAGARAGNGVGRRGFGIELVGLEIVAADVPLLPVLSMRAPGMISGGLKNNREFLGDCVVFAANVEEENRAPTFRPATSGGLLIALAPNMRKRRGRVWSVMV